MNSRRVSESEFFMWRALFAFAFTDDVLSDKEKQLLKNYQEDVLFTQDQLEVLRGDFARPQKPEDLYRKITEHQDRVRFCALARALMWSEGDPARQEEEILKRVGCLGEAEHAGVLHESRSHPHLHAYYDSYLKTGMLGVIEGSRTFEMRV